VLSDIQRISAQLAAIAELDHLLREHRLPYWLFGGWAVDFHVGRVTREHADVDIAVWLGDRSRLAALLRGGAWSHQPEVGEDGYTCYYRHGVRLEIAFLSRDASGDIYTPLEAGRGEWPHDSFGTAVAQLGGVHACLVSRESLVIDKSVARSDPETSAKDRSDVASLLHRT
jgi:Aminoglycoside-2''''-adenylyltransferase.